jgi:hypothetical protein
VCLCWNFQARPLSRGDIELRESGAPAVPALMQSLLSHVHNSGGVAFLCRSLFLVLLLLGQAQVSVGSIRLVTHSHDSIANDLHSSVLDPHVSGEQGPVEHDHTIASPSPSEDSTNPCRCLPAFDLVAPTEYRPLVAPATANVRLSMDPACDKQANAPPGKKTSRAPPSLNA